jgi:hypothetical protein
MRVRTRGLVALVAVALTARLAGDDWPAATTTDVFSESRAWFVRVVPGKSLGDTVGFGGAPKGAYARAEFYKRAADRSYRGEGTELAIAPATGAWQQCEWRNKQHLCRNDNVKRNWQPFREVE